MLFVELHDVSRTSPVAEACGAVWCGVVSRAGVNTCTVCTQQRRRWHQPPGIFLYIDSSADGVCWHIPLQASVARRQRHGRSRTMDK